jgi:hypothetical protein
MTLSCNLTLSCSRRLILTFVASCCLAAAVFASAPAPLGGVAHAAQRGCDLNYNKYPRYPQRRGKGGYFTSLRVTNTSCKDGKTQMLAWYKCRIKKGVKGRCTRSKVRGYRCTEKRGPVQSGAGEDVFSAVVTCKKRSKKVVHGYDQEV